MNELVSLIMLGLSLSMDTFSLSLVLGTMNKGKRMYYLPFIVGLFHFTLPLIGNLLGIKIISFLNLTSHFLLGFILIILAINLCIHYFKGESINFNLNLWGILFFALSVSLDSFSVGLGISALTSNYYLAYFIFAICSFTFTYLGLLIGKYSSKHLGRIASLGGIILLLILGIYHLFV